MLKQAPDWISKEYHFDKDDDNKSEKEIFESDTLHLKSDLRNTYQGLRRTRQEGNCL